MTRSLIPQEDWRDERRKQAALQTLRNLRTADEVRVEEHDFLPGGEGMVQVVDLDAWEGSLSRTPEGNRFVICCHPGQADRVRQVVERLRANEFPYRWHWTEAARPALGHRKGMHCRVIARATPGRDPETGEIERRWNTVMVEFEDGYRTITSGNALRKRRG